MGKFVNVALMCVALGLAYHAGRRDMWMQYTKAMLELQAEKAEEKK